MRSLSILITGFLLLGAGCTPSFGATFFSAEDLGFAENTMIVLEQTYLGINHPLSDQGKKTVTISSWNPSVSATLSWIQQDQQETAESRAAREAALQAPVGSETTVPDPVYETVTTQGTITTDALDDASAILLPKDWTAGDQNLSGQGNGVLWLSKKQYEELIQTRSTHLTLGAFDAALQKIHDLSTTAQHALAALQGTEASQQNDALGDATKITADADWGTMTLRLNDQQVKVKTVTAQNAFAAYVILANPNNPLILKVTPKPWALGIGVFSGSAFWQQLAGYVVTQITVSPSSQP